MSYDYNSRNADCTWFTTYDYEYLDNRTGYIFYVKDLQLVRYIARPLSQTTIFYKTFKPLQPEFVSDIFIHHKPRIAVAILL